MELEEQGGAGMEFMSVCMSVCVCRLVSRGGSGVMGIVEAGTTATAINVSLAVA